MPPRYHPENFEWEDRDLPPGSILSGLNDFRIMAGGTSSSTEETDLLPPFSPLPQPLSFDIMPLLKQEPVENHLDGSIPVGVAALSSQQSVAVRAELRCHQSGLPRIVTQRWRDAVGEFTYRRLTRPATAFLTASVSIFWHHALVEARTCREWSG